MRLFVSLPYGSFARPCKTHINALKVLQLSAEQKPIRRTKTVPTALSVTTPINPDKRSPSPNSYRPRTKRIGRGSANEASNSRKTRRRRWSARRVPGQSWIESLQRVVVLPGCSFSTLLSLSFSQRPGEAVQR